MKRVNTVRSGEWEARRTTDGRDFPIQGVDQGPPGANSFCMSIHRWIAFGPGGTSDDPIHHAPPGLPYPVKRRIVLSSTAPMAKPAATSLVQCARRAMRVRAFVRQ